MLNSEVIDMVKRAGDRRRFLRGASIAAIGAFAASKMSIAQAATADAATQTDLDVLNFALNLEYLEAEFYLRVVTGSGLATSDTTGSGTAGAVTGGKKISFSIPQVQALAEELAEEEQLHVQFIRSALTAAGGTGPVARPAIDLDTSFQTLAVAAGLVPAGTKFHPYADDLSFLAAAYVFEDVGVTAYHGAAALLSTAYVGAAAGILAIEAYHAGAIRTFARIYGEAPTTKKISNLRATLDGTLATGTPDDYGVHPATGMAGFAVHDANGIAFGRSTAQVLSIVYGSAINSDGTASATKGLFFPAGMNGNIK